jgi:hypothetical protein
MRTHIAISADDTCWQQARRYWGMQNAISADARTTAAWADERIDKQPKETCYTMHHHGRLQPTVAQAKLELAEHAGLFKSMCQSNSYRLDHCFCGCSGRQLIT